MQGWGYHNGQISQRTQVIMKSGLVTTNFKLSLRSLVNAVCIMEHFLVLLKDSDLHYSNYNGSCQGSFGSLR